MKTLKDAIHEAMTDHVENEGRLTPSNPAIVKDGMGYDYGSALHPHDGLVWDLSEGLGWWTPDSTVDIDFFAKCAAKMLADEAAG